MTQDFEHLKKLVLNGYFDEESKQYIKDLEAQLHAVTVKEKLLEHPVIADYLKHLRAEVTRCKEVLSEDAKLTDRQRIELFEKISQCREFISRFDTSEKKNLEQTIKQLINVAKT